MSPWVGEAWRVVLLLSVAALLGAAFGHYSLFFALALLLYIALHLLQLRRLEKWLVYSKRFEPPEADGVWGEVFQEIYALQKRHRKRKRRLSDMLKRFRKSTAAMPDGSVVLNKRNEIEWFNEAATHLLSLKPSQDLGQSISNLMRHPRFHDYLNAGEFEEALEISAPRRPDTRLSLRIVPYAKGQRLLLARDVTKLHRLENMRRDFVANVSHELRTPLTVIRGYIETLIDGEDEALQPYNRMLGQVESQAVRMQRIVDDLLMLSRMEAENGDARREPVNVPSMLHSLLDDARSVSGVRGHEIIGDCDADLWMLGDGDQLRSAFSNLIINAVKYTPDQGRIQIYWRRENGRPSFGVMDDGEGIPERDIPRLTERFYRVDVGRSRDSGGTGLGLAIVKHALNRHGSELEIQSRVDEGSHFSCKFPAERIASQD